MGPPGLWSCVPISGEPQRESLLPSWASQQGVPGKEASFGLILPAGLR